MNTSIRELMSAGAHFGHGTQFWNPKMADYIYGDYHRTHIINLDHTLTGLIAATDFIRNVAMENGKVLCVCAKAAGDNIVNQHAESVNMPYITHRWLGGMLTNFKTTRDSARRLQKMQQDIADGALKMLTKKEGIRLLLAKDKLNKSIGGVMDMNDLPDALFVIDVGWHKGAIREANLLNIPVVAVVDTNHSPLGVDYVIPGNDDSRYAIEIYSRLITEAIAEGKKARDAQTVAEIPNINPNVKKKPL